MFGISWVRLAIYAAIVAAVVLAWSTWLAAHDAKVATAATNKERNAWLERDAIAAAAGAKETQRRLERQGDSHRETTAQLAAAAAAVRAERAGAGKLRDELAAATAARRRDPAAVTVCAPAEAAADLHADLFGRADTRAGELAEAAQAFRIAGEACEREYDALTGAKP